MKQFKQENSSSPIRGRILKNVKMLSLAFFITLIGVSETFATKFSSTSDTYAQQTSSIRTGVVFEASSGLPLPGVSVVIKGTASGTATDMDGKFSIRAKESDVLVISFIGMLPQEYTVKGSKQMNIYLIANSLEVDEIIVTALGIKRSEKSLGYAVTNVSGDELNKVKSVNIASSLNGRVAGVNVSSSSGLGGSSNIVIRGGSSITGNNQALFVIDGVVLNNTSLTSTNTLRGGFEGGYDYGNFASDINPEDIESMSILKGASATALYGSRGSNGVIIIKTKSGKSRSGIGVSVSSSVNFETINKSTLPDYQNEYGGGISQIEIDGVMQNVVDYSVDESWGAKFDPNLMVRHWDSWDPSDKANYGKSRPWVAPNNMDKFFETGVMWVNSVALSGGSDMGTYRVSYTNVDQKGTLPNQKQTKNNFALNSNFKLNDKLSVQVNSQYNLTESKGRPGLGYSSSNSLSFMGSMMWHQRNLDFDRLSNYQTPSGVQKPWNRKAYNDEKANFWDNPYWTRYKNYQEDKRSRFVGAVTATYELTDWAKVSIKASTDVFSFVSEERIAKGGKGTSFYSKSIRTVSEDNLEANLLINKNLSEDLTFTGIFGITQRNNSNVGISLSTVEGLVVDGLYAIKNSKSAELDGSDWDQSERVNSAFGSFSFGYKNFLYLDLTARNDWSSTLPIDEASFFYPSISSSLVFSELVDLDFLNFGKVRLNWAQTGNAAGISQLKNIYYSNGTFGDAIKFASSTRLRNPELKAELTSSVEAGLDLKMFNNRVGLDFSIYKKNSVDQIILASVSSATGFYSKYMNSGELQNQGIEIGLNLVPIKTKDFTWSLYLNWSKNVSEVLSLAAGVDDLTINSNGAKIIARVGEAFGIITGTDYVYNEKGEKLIKDNGAYRQSDAGQIIGDINPDWMGGASNSFTYKNFSLNALISARIGGDVYSFTEKYGRMSGVLSNTIGLNDKGIDRRTHYYNWSDWTVANPDGGVLLDGVNENTGDKNDVRREAKWVDGDLPQSEFIVDCSYIKLRELSLSYKMNKKALQSLPIENVTFSIMAKNLAILYSKSDNFDPEVVNGVGVGGLEGGSLPSTRSYGFSLKFNF